MANKHRILQLTIFITLSPNELSESFGGGTLGKSTNMIYVSSL